VTDPDYAIGWTATAGRALTRLPDKVGCAVIEFIYGSLPANPHRVGEPSSLSLKACTAPAVVTTESYTGSTTRSTASTSS
jgi:hypothetical protein